MAMTRMRSAWPAFLAATWLAVALTPAAKATPIEATYSTSGTIGTTGITGTPDITFHGVSNGMLTTGQPFNIGQFTLTTPSDGTTPVYNMTPFQITVSFTGASGDPSLSNQAPITLRGILETSLNGSSLGPSAAEFLAFAPPGPDPIRNAYTYWILDGSAVSYGLYPTQTSITLAPSGQNGGTFEIQAELDAYPTPEPSALATLVVAVTGLFLKAHLRRRNRTQPRR